MKKIIILFSILFFTPVFTQEYPLDYAEDVPDGAYYKDMNGELNKYIGLWKGNWDGKTVYLEFKKMKVHNKNYYMDEILGERKIINSNGVVEIDRITNFDNDSAEFWGIYNSLKYNGKKKFLFFPKNMCRKRASLHIINLTSTQMTLHFEYEPSYYDPNCQHNAYVQQHDDFPINFPKDIVLTKQ